MILSSEQVKNREIAFVIGERLRGLRLERGLTQAKMSKEIGIGESTWRMYELGQRIPSDEIKMKIASYFKKTVDELFFTI